jgi:hypothetical protein
MNKLTRVRLLLAPALLVMLAADAGAMSDVIKGKTYLVRPDPLLSTPPDTNAKGRLMIDTKISTGRDRLTVIAQGVDKTLVYNLFVADPENEGGFSDPIALTGNGTTKTLKLDTDKGDSLPLGMSAASLEGLEVRIVVGADPDDETAIYLRGVVPALGTPKEKLKTTQDLALAGDVPDTNAKGKLWIQSTASNGDELLRIKVSALDFNSHEFSVWIEDESNSGTFTEAGVFTQTKPNAGMFERRTKQGDPLPVGAISGSEFSQRIVQVRNQIDEVFLATLVPTVN